MGSNPRISCVVSKSDSDHWNGYYGHLETFMGVDQRTGVGSKTHIPRVVSK